MTHDTYENDIRITHKMYIMMGRKISSKMYVLYIQLNDKIYPAKISKVDPHHHLHSYLNRMCMARSRSQSHIGSQKKSKFRNSLSCCGVGVVRELTEPERTEEPLDFFTLQKSSQKYLWSIPTHFYYCTFTILSHLSIVHHDHGTWHVSKKKWTCVFQHAAALTLFTLTYLVFMTLEIV